MTYKWSEMGPRARDALVAEKVMIGYERFVYSYSGTSFIYYGVGVRGSYRIEDRFRLNNLQWDVSTDGLELGSYVGPYFTTNISATWEVVEQLKRNGWNPCIVWNSIIHKWIVQFLDRTHYPRGMAMHELECHAICIAALRAVGVEVET